MTREVIVPANVHRTTGYSHAIKAGNTIYLAGQIALDAQGNLVGRGDFAAQAEQVFQNLQSVLAAAGASLSDVVKFTYYLTSADDIQTLRDVRNKYISADSPASTLLVITRLAQPDLLIEIEAIAVAG